MNVNDQFPSKYLKAADLKGRRLQVKISEVLKEAINDKDMKIVAYFNGKEKGLVLNKTNATSIAEIAQSPETDNWVNVDVVLYPTKTMYSGQMVDAIRIDWPPNAKPAPAQSDDISF